MPDIEFSQFNSRSFEQLSQALAARFISSGISIFGDGADGAREASYRGPMQYPSSAPWHGYFVMQAKFLQHPSGNTNDTTWLLTQIKSELEKFLNPEAGLSKPEYYIMVTNIRLSSFAQSASAKRRRRKSGHDRVQDIFNKYSSALGLKGWEVWHHDKIRTLLDGAPELRTSYRGWLTSNDLIHEIIQEHFRSTPDFERTIRRFLMSELRAQRYTKLQQAGRSDETSPRVDEIFIDLPTSAFDLVDRAATPSQRTPKNIVQFLADQANQKLDPKTIIFERDITPPGRDAKRPPNRFLIGSIRVIYAPSF